MSTLKRFLIRLFLFIILLYTGICALIWLNQESLLFHPERLSKQQAFSFSIPFREVSIPVESNVTLNGVLFPVEQSKGLVFFLHGNAGNVSILEGPAAFYTNKGYDFFAFDYRGFGKSTGEITDETTFYADAQQVYQQVTKAYRNKPVIIVGYSVGSATATKLAAENQPQKLLLMAPYYSMKDLASRHYPIFPSFLVSYPFETFRFLQKTTVPVLIVHGEHDGVIPASSSALLKPHLKQNDRYLLLPYTNHNNIQNNTDFQLAAALFLSH